MKKLFLLSALALTTSVFADRELCERNMERVYADGKSTIDIFLGYYDNHTPEDNTNFRTMRKIIADLTRPCVAPIFGLCNFRWVKGTPGLYSRRFRIHGDIREVKVQIHNSAVRASNNPNDQAQKDLSALIDARFQDRVKNGEIVFYFGHSRDGGGPDFSVPRYRNGHTDYPWYHRNKPGYTKLRQSLQGTRMKIYGQSSCSSINHFARGIKAAAPNLTYVGSTRTTSYKETTDHLLWSLSNLIKGECDFVENFNQNSVPGQMRFVF